MLKFKKKLDICEVLALGTKISPLGGRPGGVWPPSVNLGPPNISENTRARMLKLKTQLDVVKYSLYVKKNSPLGGAQGAYGPLV